MFPVPAPEKHGAAFLFPKRTAQDHIIASAVIPYFWIARMSRVSNLFIPDHRNDLSFPIPVVKLKSILRNHHCLACFIDVLHRDMDIFFLFFQIPHCGIIEVQPAVFLQRASGKYSVAVISFSREYRNIQMLPMHQIFTYRMPPMHGSPYGRIGEALVKQVIPSLVINKSVWIIYPISRRF